MQESGCAAEPHASWLQLARNGVEIHVLVGEKIVRFLPPRVRPQLVRLQAAQQLIHAERSHVLGQQSSFPKKPTAWRCSAGHGVHQMLRGSG